MKVLKNYKGNSMDTIKSDLITSLHYDNIEKFNECIELLKTLPETNQVTELITNACNAFNMRYYVPPFLLTRFILGSK
jgi:hypothetical protein